MPTGVNTRAIQTVKNVFIDNWYYCCFLGKIVERHIIKSTIINENINMYFVLRLREETPFFGTEFKMASQILASSKIQHWRRKNVHNRSIKKYLRSREFNEWLWAPNAIGGKRHKHNTQKWLQQKRLITSKNIDVCLNYIPTIYTFLTNMIVCCHHSSTLINY